MPLLKWQSVMVVACVFASMMSIGCNGVEGPATEPVTGVVTLDGQPVEGAQVVFSPVGGGKGARAASGTTDASGNFALTTFNPKDGAILGSYTVTISKVEGGTVGPDVSGLSEEEATKKAMEAHYQSEAYKNMGNPKAREEVKDLLPTKYKVADTSGLKADVKAGDNNFEFKLTSGG